MTPPHHDQPQHGLNEFPRSDDPHPQGQAGESRPGQAGSEIRGAGGLGENVDQPLASKVVSRPHQSVPSHLAEKFWKNVDVRGPNDCWLWMGAMRPNGYGLFHFGGRGKYIRAHRAAYSLTHPRADIRGLSVCHVCDNPRCVNPRHLWLGSHQQNMRDMARKGRAASGEAHGRAKLTLRQAQAIRRDKRQTCRVASEYGVSDSTVRRIRCGSHWRMLP
jgi:hypothetical protein